MCYFAEIGCKGTAFFLSGKILGKMQTSQFPLILRCFSELGVRN